MSNSEVPEFEPQEFHFLEWQFWKKATNQCALIELSIETLVKFFGRSREAVISLLCSKVRHSRHWRESFVNGWYIKGVQQNHCVEVNDAGRVPYCGMCGKPFKFDDDGKYVAGFCYKRRRYLWEKLLQ